MVDILDHRGQPFRRAEVAEPQTARVGILPENIGLHPSRGLTPARLATILEEAEQGEIQAQLDLAEDMEEKDGHIFAELSKRRRALLGLPWDIEPPRNATAEEERVTELVREIVADIDLDDVVLDLADAIGKAYSCTEIGWQRVDGLWAPTELWNRPQRWFRVSRYADETITLRDGSGTGAPLVPFGWMVHVHKAKSGHLSRAGLHRILAWPFLFKNYSVRDLAEFLEIYGLPLRLGTYPPGASDREKSTLLKAVVNIGHAAAGIVPEGMAIDFKEAAEGQSDPFVAMIDWCERTQSKAILGATLTSQADRGSNTNALGNVHNEVRRDLLISDARQIALTLSRDLLYPIAALNSAAIRDPRRGPRWVYQTQEPEDLKLYAESLPELVGVGMRIPEAWARERLQIPEPEEGDTLLAAPAPPPGAVPPAPGPEAMRSLAALAAGGAVPTTDEQAARLETEAAAAAGAFAERLREMVTQADSLEDLQTRIERAFEGAPSHELGAVMRRALAAAELAGRYDLTRGV